MRYFVDKVNDKLKVTKGISVRRNGTIKASNFLEIESKVTEI